MNQTRLQQNSFWLDLTVRLRYLYHRKICSRGDWGKKSLDGRL